MVRKLTIGQKIKKYEKEIENLGFCLPDGRDEYEAKIRDKNDRQNVMTFRMNSNELSTCCGVIELGSFSVYHEHRSMSELFQRKYKRELKAFLYLLKIMFLENIYQNTDNIKTKIIKSKPILFTTNGKNESLFVEKALEDLEEFQKVSVTVNLGTDNVITVWIGLAKR